MRVAERLTLSGKQFQTVGPVLYNKNDFSIKCFHVHAGLTMVRVSDTESNFVELACRVEGDQTDWEQRGRDGGDKVYRRELDLKQTVEM